GLAGVAAYSAALRARLGCTFRLRLDKSLLSWRAAKSLAVVLMLPIAMHPRHIFLGYPVENLLHPNLNCCTLMGIVV
ncbi:MAG: hypothetical protein ACYC3I_20460, partial [Gemmataceae bacterium]